MVVLVSVAFAKQIGSVCTPETLSNLVVVVIVVERHHARRVHTYYSCEIAYSCQNNVSLTVDLCTLAVTAPCFKRHEIVAHVFV